MNFPKKLKAIRGLSLVEIIVVMGIMGVMATVGLVSYGNLRNAKALDNMVNRMATDIIYIMGQSKAQESGLQWWIYFNNSEAQNYYLICQGATYSVGGSCGSSGTEIQRIQVTPGLSISYSDDLIFQKATGLPVDSSGNQITAPITITVTGATGSKNITIDKNGRVDY